MNANDIITLKMVGGDEVVARLVEDSGFRLTIKKPMVVTMAQQGFGLMPYSLTINSDADIEISQEHVVFVSKTLKEVADAYIKQTTGLMMP